MSCFVYLRWQICMDVPLWVKVNQRFLSCRTYTRCSACQKHPFLSSASCWSVEWEGSKLAAPLGCSSPALLRPPRGRRASFPYWWLRVVGQFWQGLSSILRFLLPSPFFPFYNLCARKELTVLGWETFRWAMPRLFHTQYLPQWLAGCTCTRNGLIASAWIMHKWIFKMLFYLAPH